MIKETREDHHDQVTTDPEDFDKMTDSSSIPLGKKARLTREDITAASTLLMAVPESIFKESQSLKSPSSSSSSLLLSLAGGDSALPPSSTSATGSTSAPASASASASIMIEKELSMISSARSNRKPAGRTALKSAKDRHEAHILSEKRRREQINQGFADLRQLIPICQYSFDTKAVILQKAIQYIMHLQSRLYGQPCVFPNPADAEDNSDVLAGQTPFQRSQFQIRRLQSQYQQYDPSLERQTFPLFPNDINEPFSDFQSSNERSEMSALPPLFLERPKALVPCPEISKCNSFKKSGGTNNNDNNNIIGNNINGNINSNNVNNNIIGNINGNSSTFIYELPGNDEITATTTTNNYHQSNNLSRFASNNIYNLNRSHYEGSKSAEPFHFVHNNNQSYNNNNNQTSIANPNRNLSFNVSRHGGSGSGENSCSGVYAFSSGNAFSSSNAFSISNASSTGYAKSPANYLLSNPNFESKTLAGTEKDSHYSLQKHLSNGPASAFYKPSPFYHQSPVSTAATKEINCQETTFIPLTTETPPKNHQKIIN